MGFGQYTTLHQKSPVPLSCMVAPVEVMDQPYPGVSARTRYDMVWRWKTSRTVLSSYLVGGSTQLKNISQNGNLPQAEVEIKNNWNHHLVIFPIHHGSKLCQLVENNALKSRHILLTSHECKKTILKVNILHMELWFRSFSFTFLWVKGICR